MPRLTAVTQTTLIAAVLAAAGAAQAQVVFSEDFQSNGSITTLQSRGWVFRNQSAPVNRLGWEVDTSGGPVGTLWLQASTWAGPSEVSTWAIMPAVPGAQPGMPIRFHASGRYTNPPRIDYMELRYSPTGGTGTGTSHTDVGDFTQVLWSRTSPQLGLWWTEHEVALPGTGRLAWRYVRAAGGSSGNMGVDGILIGSDTAPIPTPGQTVTWTAAMSPITLASPTTILAGGTVVVEPGVEVVVDADVTVLGTIRGGSMTAAPITLRGGARLTVDDPTGELELTNASISCALSQWEKTRVVLRGCEMDFAAVQGVGLGRIDSVTVVEDCSVAGPVFYVGGQSRLSNVNFAGDLLVLEGYTLLDNVVSSGSIEIVREYQPILVDRVTVDGADGPAIVARSAQFGAADFLLGPNNTLVNCEYPVLLRSGGLHPDSTIPASGNVNNAIELESSGGGLRYNRVTLPNLGVPYEAPTGDMNNDIVTVQGGVDIDPGTVFRFGPTTGILFLATQSDNIVRGLPGNPIRFGPLVPQTHWDGGVILDAGMSFFEHAVVDYSGIGAISGGFHRVIDCTISNSPLGMTVSGAFLRVSGTSFLDNGIGVEESSSPISVGLDLNGHERANSFIGNDTAVLGILGPNGEFDRIPAEHNWWGAPDGPSNVAGPLGYGHSGSGDAVTGNVDSDPFLAAPPDLSDQRPIVRMITRPYRWSIRGTKVILEWTASDDGAITQQWIDAQVGPNDYVVVAADLTADDRSYEFALPDNGSTSYDRFRLAVVDDAGQVSYEPFLIRVPSFVPSGSGSVTTDLSGGRTPGEEWTICYSAFSPTATGASAQLFLELGPDERWARGPAGAFGNGCTYSTLRTPRVSTDRARIAIDMSGGNNNEWYFSEYFTIRPRAEIGDAPPTVAMTSPTPGETFTGGDVIPIRWTASDDEGLRAFKIQYSTDGGRAWHTARHNLAGNARAFDWRLPRSTGIADLRMRVVAVDHRFQNSAAGDDLSFTVNAGGPPTCPADWDGSGGVDGDDITAFFTDWQMGDADIDRSGGTDGDDITVFFDHWQTGC